MLIASLDVGQVNDFSALSIVQRVEPPSATVEERTIEYKPSPIGPIRIFERVPVDPATREPELHVRHLERWRGIAYTALVEQVKHRLAPLDDVVLVVDGTGVGRAIVDLFFAIGVSVAPVTITAGAKATFDPPYHNVPKRDIAGALAILLQSRRLKIAASLPDAPILQNELANFKVKISAGGHDSYEADWRQGVHDDLVLSVGCAVWYASTFGAPIAYGPNLWE